MSTVWVVDDDRSLRTLVAKTLSIDGHRVIEAGEGQTALGALAADDIDVVLLDLRMPVMDGWAVLWTLHDLPVHPPVIVMSGLPEEQDERPPLGAFRYLHKPFPIEDVVSTVEEALAASN